MTRKVQAVYEHGVLRPLEPLNLAEKELVTVIIGEKVLAEHGAAALSVAEPAPMSANEFDRLLDELASGPTLPHLPPDFSRADVYADSD